MKPFVGIGITTYLDISSKAHGAAVFEAYEASIPTLTPDRVRVWSGRHDVSDAHGFANYWRTKIPFVLQEGSRRGPVLDKGSYIIGAEWRRTGRGGGKVEFRPELQDHRADHLLIKHPYSVRSDWLGLFRRLVGICQPAHAMLHLFSEREVLEGKGGRLDAFDEPFAGEEHFVSWLSSLGEWRRPDPWELEARRRYRFLPELSWANFLGPEFDGQFHKDLIEQHAAQFWSAEIGILFAVTNDISDVVKKPEYFASSRRILRTAFKEGFFRR